ncbi:MAG TPA: 5'-3' exonuclease [Jatrophihabitans sp.]|jgi:5'-3' exonuclease
MLIDAAGLYFRAYYGLPESLTAPDGRPVNAIRGFLDMSATLIERRKPTRYIACLDLDWRPEFRVELLPSYKTHRVAADGIAEEIPETLAPQVPLLLEVLAALGIATSGAGGFEADDVIATLAAQEEDAGETVEIVTGDRDLMALATDHVTILYTAQGLAKLGVLSATGVLEKYGVPAAHYADFAVLRGDPSDGLPGVGGVGEKTAAMLVNSFGSVESILAAAESGADGLPAPIAKKILAARDYLALAPDVVRGRCDVPLALTRGELPVEPADPDRLEELVTQLGIAASVERIRKAIRAATS